MMTGVLTLILATPRAAACLPAAGAGVPASA